MGAPHIEHTVSEDGRVHTVTARAFGSGRWYRATIPVCDCGLPPCRLASHDPNAYGPTQFKARKRARDLRDRCARTGEGHCHEQGGWHVDRIETHIEALRKSYMPPGRRHTPRYPSNGSYRPTGKPEVIADGLGWDPADVRNELAKATA